MRSNAAPLISAKFSSACFLFAAFVYTAFAPGCGSETSTLAACDPPCAAGESCDEGVCKPAFNGVDAGSDGGSVSVVDAGAPDAGCTSDSQCENEVCDPTTKSCVPSLCDPACPAWETCTQRTCELSSGRCNSNSDCPNTLPICDANHECTAPPVTAPAQLTYAALIITNQAYEPIFSQLAQLHTLTGVPTRVATVESICASAASGCSTTNACSDSSKAIKDYLIEQHAAGIEQVVLGGDASIVPSRETEATYSNAIYGVDYDEQFLSDYYFADLSEWDTNHDCIYGSPTSDSPTYLPSIGVTRISVSSQAEAQTYLAKAQAYLTSYDTSRLNTALFLSNVATDVTIPDTSITVPIDSALYFETPGRTLSTIPDTFDITRMYSSLEWPGSTTLSVAAEESAFEQGYNIAVHSGHGDEADVTVEQDGSKEFSGDMAYALQNSQYPILISCACEAATFSDGDGCAGQQFITAPKGGGIGYLGNSTIGLGIAGGMQLLDGFLRYAFSKTNPLVGEALMAAHANLPTSDGLTIPDVPIVGSVLLPVVDITSWRWTEKAATYLGDGLLPVYTDITLSRAPAISASRTSVGNFSQITFAPATSAVGTLTALIGNDLYQLPISGTTPVSITVAGAPGSVAYGFASATTLAFYKVATLP